jgi:hypothetical protein
MNKLIFFYFTLLTLTIVSASAQITPFLRAAPPKTSPVKTQRSSGLESTPTKTTPSPVTNPTYLLSSVKVTIKTGNDNKEALSNVNIELSVRDAAFSIFAQNSITNELKSNSDNTFGLENSYTYVSAYNPGSIPPAYDTSATGTQTIQLSNVENYGLSLRIIYKPNFFADAWKIENVSLSLEFRDLSGKLHPVSGQKTIQFSNAATFLDNFDKRILICTADKYFNPLTSFVTKDFSVRW